MANNENVNKVVYGDTTIMDITDTTAEASDVAAGEVFYTRSGARSVGTGNYMDKAANPTADDILVSDANGQAVDSGVSIGSVARTNQLPGQATETSTGTIKLNPSESVDVNADGQLTVGGRLGQYPNGGVYYPANIEPTGVGGSAFLMTDGAKGLNAGGREFCILAGANLTVKSTAAGSTVYRARNTQNNRTICFAAQNGFAAIDQADAAANGTAHIESIVFANGDPISFYFGAEETNNDIIITLSRSVNPSAATTKLRLYGNATSTDVITIGQGTGSKGGKVLALGQSCFCGGNQNMALGNGSIVTANNSVALGHTHLVNQQFCFAAGQGHDFTNATNGTSAVGIASELGADTAFAVGNGTFDGSGNTKRSNALEVTKDGGVIVPSSTSGSAKKFKITVDDSGTITATEV